MPLGINGSNGTESHCRLHNEKTYLYSPTWYTLLKTPLTTLRTASP